ncbi:protease modulator HflC [Novosphingobium sp.]|jgi:membrane protease subunit HflC|uniref:protease modulator HflC n=1 Tax=Novosphingobium sp. TaxID=1874826 RepID=UPI0022BDA943|nr:protease modulator HflC [Novosphingobium sp.]MCZ8017965.1 protease modulator HflC [Novosphingobium sp.]MCZ8034284.1 protease modulator HflC [Novosphingobium sp.]MCZ8052252.1 protease modulator HflC [Novosphingobium sp.]MCZ8061320.1 protease modulator HflC [Novosphingobium sp.]MCZ8232748.1 protease modulator HflC [Novosphingobium sp.]
MIEQLWQRSKKAIIAGVAVVILAMSSLVIVPETQQVVVVRLGEPVRKINAFKPNQDFGQTGAGISWRIPFIEQLVWVDKRLMSFPMERQTVLSSDQLRLEVTAYARFRVIDPVKMVKTAGSTDRVMSQLQPIMTSVLRQELGKRTFQSLLNAERGAAMSQIKENLDRQAREYGAQVIDVRIQRADLPAGALESAFARMQAAREQEATTIQAQGQKQAQLITSEAEARATQIYANAFGKDPAFYDFYRAMKSYDATFANQANKGSSTIILSPDNEYLRQFRGR